MEETLIKISAAINSPELQAQLFPARLILGGFGIFFFLMIIVLVTRITWTQFMIFDISEFFQFRRFGLRTTGKRWVKILARLDAGNQAEYKLAVMEADTIFTDVLKSISVPGETPEEKLGNIAPSIISNIEEMRQARELRNTIVHDPDYALTLEEARRVLEIYETAFRQLDLIR